MDRVSVLEKFIITNACDQNMICKILGDGERLYVATKHGKILVFDDALDMKTVTRIIRNSSRTRSMSIIDGFLYTVDDTDTICKWSSIGDFIDEWEDTDDDTGFTKIILWNNCICTVRTFYEIGLFNKQLTNKSYLTIPASQFYDAIAVEVGDKQVLYALANEYLYKVNAVGNVFSFSPYEIFHRFDVQFHYLIIFSGKLYAFSEITRTFIWFDLDKGIKKYESRLIYDSVLQRDEDITCVSVWNYCGEYSQEYLCFGTTHGNVYLMDNNNKLLPYILKNSKVNEHGERNKNDKIMCITPIGSRLYVATQNEVIVYGALFHHTKLGSFAKRATQNLYEFVKLQKQHTSNNTKRIHKDLVFLFKVELLKPN